MTGKRRSVFVLSIPFALVAGLAALVLASTGPRRSGDVRAARAAEETVEQGGKAEDHGTVPLPPIRRGGPQETASAMDDASVRQEISRLRLAVLSGDKAAVEGAQAGLRRYGTAARLLVAEERDAERNPDVRAALAAVERGMR